MNLSYSLIRGWQHCPFQLKIEKLDRVVVYVAAKPPRSILSQLAARLNLTILYLPLGSISPTTRRKTRVMHILHGHDKREIAGEFIW